MALAKASGCVDCGCVGPPESLEFDHVRGVKVAEVSWLAMKCKGSAGLLRVMEEIEKCEVRCAPCHRKRHDDEGGAGWRARRNPPPTSTQPSLFDGVDSGV